MVFFDSPLEDIEVFWLEFLIAGCKKHQDKKQRKRGLFSASWQERIFPLNEVSLPRFIHEQLLSFRSFPHSNHHFNSLMLCLHFSYTVLSDINLVQQATELQGHP